MSAICSGTTSRPDDDDEEHVPAAELHPRERVGGERGDGDRDHRRRDRHREAVEQRVRETARVEDAPVVVQRPLTGSERVAERRPPSRRVDEAFGTERRDQHADGRDQPDDDHDEDRDAHEPAALADADRRLLLRGLPRRLEAVVRLRWEHGARRGSPDLLLLAELPDVPDHHRHDGHEQDHRDRRAAAVVVAR